MGQKTFRMELGKLLRAMIIYEHVPYFVEPATFRPIEWRVGVTLTFWPNGKGHSVLDPTIVATYRRLVKVKRYKALAEYAMDVIHCIVPRGPKIVTMTLREYLKLYPETVERLEQAITNYSRPSWAVMKLARLDLPV